MNIQEGSLLLKWEGENVKLRKLPHVDIVVQCWHGGNMLTCCDQVFLKKIY